MALALHEVHFCLMFDRLLYGTEYKERLYSTSGSILDRNTSFQLLHISILREYLGIEFKVDANAANIDAIEHVIDDFVLLITLYDNEYLPPIPSLNMEILLESYKFVLRTLPENTYIVHDGHIQFDSLQRVLLNLSKQEGPLLSTTYEALIRYYRRLSGYRYNSSDNTAVTGMTAEDEVQRIPKVPVHIEHAIQTLNAGESNELLIQNVLLQNLKNTETSKEDDEVAINLEICMDLDALNENLECLRAHEQDLSLTAGTLPMDYILRYYREHFGIEYAETDISRICHDYLKTLELSLWVDFGLRFNPFCHFYVL